MPRVVRPVTTSLCHDGWNLCLCYKIRSLHDVDIETSADMPSDMAMEWPNAWVIGVKLDNKVAWSTGDRVVSGDELHISALRVAWIHDGTVPFTNTL